ncbi:MAG: hypothetical protein AMJ94_15280 [Deltaproteobacteria bacterium SM23_61]|nr:MAG: hypothetical protein AMJ94_15280 [Deltaproteobacteria bacterium SM23_61]
MASGSGLLWVRTRTFFCETISPNFSSLSRLSILLPSGYQKPGQRIPEKSATNPMLPRREIFLKGSFPFFSFFLLHRQFR